MSNLTDAFRLSPLPALGPFLIERAQSNQELQASLDDGLADYTEGATVAVAALRSLLDEWLDEGQLVLHQTNQGLEPFKWLAISDHLTAVQTFRELL